MTESSFQGNGKVEKGFCFSPARDINQFNNGDAGLSVKRGEKG